MKKIPVRQIPHDMRLSNAVERFKIRSIKDILGGKCLKEDLHRHDFFLILFLQSGSGSHEIDFTHYQVHDNSIFFLRPGQVHQLELSADCSGFLIEFNNEFYYPKDNLSSNRLRKASNKNYCELEARRFEKLKDILTYIFEEYNSREEGYIDIIKANLEIFFIEFLRQSRNPKGNSSHISPYVQDRFEEFLKLLEKHVSEFKQVSHYLQMMTLSAYQLNNITQTCIGKTPSALIDEQIVLEAKRLLLATPNQIKDIAADLGYEDVSYFIRFFKKQTGYSPDAFRQNSR